VSGFVDDPLNWLVRASANGDVAVIDPDGPITSRSAARRTVAVFGQRAVRQVLSDLDTFGMPVSVSERYDLPPVLANLNSALFSMTGPRHRSRQRLLADCLGPAFAAEHNAAIDRGVADFLRGWRIGDQVPLLSEMRRFARLVAQQVVLGTTAEDPIGARIQRYFDLRRRYGSRLGVRTAETLDELVTEGTRVDHLLRAQVAALREGGDNRYSALGHLCRQGGDLTVDELVAHANILFMSSSEPIATAMTWILLGLTQHPRLRAAIRDAPDETLVAGVVNEFLRLVPPSALMVRLTRRPAEVAGVMLEPKTEVLISPFAEHRREDVFADPLSLSPQRWIDARPGPFQFLPFGNGARSCLGKRIAQATLQRGTAKLLAGYDPVLPVPRRLDWSVNVTLMPAGDPMVLLAEPGSPVGGILSGPAAELLNSPPSSS